MITTSDLRNATKKRDRETAAVTLLTCNTTLQVESFYTVSCMKKNQSRWKLRVNTHSAQTERDTCSHSSGKQIRGERMQSRTGNREQLINTGKQWTNVLICWWHLVAGSAVDGSSL